MSISKIEGAGSNPVKDSNEFSWLPGKFIIIDGKIWEIKNSDNFGASIEPVERKK